MGSAHGCASSACVERLTEGTQQSLREERQNSISQESKNKSSINCIKIAKKFCDRIHGPVLDTNFSLAFLYIRFYIYVFVISSNVLCIFKFCSMCCLNYKNG